MPNWQPHSPEQYLVILLHMDCTSTSAFGQFIELPALGLQVIQILLDVKIQQEILIKGKSN